MQPITQPTRTVRDNAPYRITVYGNGFREEIFEGRKTKNRRITM